jgi:MbtH protein
MFDNLALDYEVVVNHEEQYSIWPADREIPVGWRRVGRRGAKQECLTWIEQTWTDMRPLSVREHMTSNSVTEPA